MSQWTWAVGGAAFVAFAGIAIVAYQQLIAAGADARDVVGFGLALVCAIATLSVGIFAGVTRP